MKTKYIAQGIIGLFSVALIISTAYTVHYKNLYNNLKSEEQRKKKETKIEINQPENKKRTEALKNRIKELESQLQLKIVQPIEEPFQGPARSYNTSSSRSKHQSVDDLKESDPERYNKIMKYYEKINCNISDAVQDKLVYFNDLNTVDMSEKEKKNHQKLLEKLAKLDQFSQNNLEKSGLELRDTIKKQQKKVRDLYKNMTQMKEFLILDAVRQAGLSMSESKRLLNQLKKVEEATSYRSFYHKSK